MPSTVTVLLLVVSLLVVAADDRPNLLVILTDQQRFDAIQRVQQDLETPKTARIQTPNIDRLSHEGAYFVNAYSHCAVCGPARVAFLTGATIEHSGVRTNAVDDESLAGTDAEWKVPKLKTYDMILTEQGYVAEYYGKWHAPVLLGYCYSNDVRVGGDATAWFGKYKSNGSKLYVDGMTEHYRYWLDGLGVQKNKAVLGEQIDTFARRAYTPDPLDSRYKQAPSSTLSSVKEPDQHGMYTFPNDMSITAQQGTETLDALTRLGASGKPFSLHVSFHSPHSPILATERYHSMYDPVDLLAPDNIDDDMRNSAYRELARKFAQLGYNNTRKIQRMTATYYGLITEIDGWIGRLLEKLDDLNLADNTLVIFSSDHGEMLGSHGMREKNVFYEPSAHVPLMMRFPGKIPRTNVTNPVSHLDIHSTILDYLGVKGDYATDGSSLRQYIETNDDHDDFVVTLWNFTDGKSAYKTARDPAFMIRKGSWKLILPVDGSPLVDMLYDIRNDPAELDNLVGLNGQSAPADIIGKAEHLKTMLVLYLAEKNHPAAMDATNRRMWRQEQFWVGDRTIRFRKPLRDGTRTEFLYMGAPTDTAVKVTSIRIEGELAQLFSIDSTEIKKNLVGGQNVAVIPIKYRHQENVDPLATATVVISLTSGFGISVELLPPYAIEPETEQKSEVVEGDKDVFSALTKQEQGETPADTKTESAPAKQEPETQTVEAVVSHVKETTDFVGQGECVTEKLVPSVRLSRGEMVCTGDRRFGLSSSGDLGYWIAGYKIWTAGITKGDVLLLQGDGVLKVTTATDSGNKLLWDSNSVSKPERRTGKQQNSVLEINGNGPHLIAQNGVISWVFACQYFFC